MANSESEMKVDIEDLLTPPNQMEDFEIKEEQLETGETNLNSNYFKNESFKSKMEEEILLLYEKLDTEKVENPKKNTDGQRKLLKIRQLVQKYETINQRKLFEVKNENATLKGRNVMDKFEVTNLKQELEKAKSTNQFLSTKIRKLETASNQMIGEKQILQKRNIEKLQLIQRKISNKYACEVCQKDWDSMNDLEKHLQKNRHGVQGELKIEVADGRTIISFVKNLVEDLDTIPTGLDVPVAVENDPGKEDFIDDPIERDEQNIVQDLFQLPIPAQALSTKTMAMSAKKCGKRNDLAVTTAAKKRKISTPGAIKQPKISKDSAPMVITRGQVAGTTWVRGKEKTRRSVRVIKRRKFENEKETQKPKDKKVAKLKTVKRPAKENDNLASKV